MKRIIYYIAGILLVGIGINLLIHSDKGLDPWGVFNVTIADSLNLSLGTFYIYSGFIFVAINAVIQKKIPDIFGMITSFLMGMSIDLFQHLPSNVIIHLAWIEFLFGLILFCLGLALYFYACLPKSPVDDLILSTQIITNKSFRVSKIILDSLVLVLGILLGGHIGLGTILMVLFVGPLISLFTKILEEKNGENNLSRLRRYTYSDTRKL